MATYSGANAVQTHDITAYVAAYASTNAMPADSAWGTAWGGVYRDVGGLDGGLGFNIGMDYTDITFDQSIDPVAVIASGRNIRLTAGMAEITLQNLKDAITQGTISTVAASSGVRGHSDLSLDSTIAVNYLTAGFDVKASLGDGEALRPVVWKAQCRSAVATTFGPAGKAILPLEVQAFPDPLNSNRVLTFRDIIAALP